MDEPVPKCRDRPAPEMDWTSVPPAWQALIRYCRQIGHGEIERLSIQNGLPVLAQTVTKKIKFTT